MNEKNYDTVFDKFIEQAHKNDYKPSAIEPYELYVKRKKAVFEERHGERMREISDGILLFSMLETENEKIKNLITSFLALDTIVEEKGLLTADIEADGKKIVETNLFGLTDDDFDYLMQMSGDVLQIGKVAEASAMYQALTFLFPTRLECWLNWANVEYQHQFDYPYILSIYEDCLKIFNNPVIYYCIAMCHIKGNELHHAVDALHQTVALCDQYEDKEIKAKASALLKKLPAAAFK